MISYGQAIFIGLLQGVTELFPISSLGHSVLVPVWFGWDGVVQAQSQPESFYLAFLVALHVATAIALVVYFRDQWARIVRGLIRSIRTRRVETPDERLGWLLVVATIPAGATGLLLEHLLRTVFAKPLAAAAFLLLNGVILLVGERMARSRRMALHPSAGGRGAKHPSRVSRRLDTLEVREAGLIGVAQTAAPSAGVSRSGITMVAGLVRGLDHEDAARFSFLLATPIIGAAGLYKLPDLLGPLGDGVRGQAIVGSLVAGVAAYVSVRWLLRFFETKTLWPFGIYCVAFGFASVVRFA